MGPPKPGKNPEELTPERTSRTESTNTTTRNPSKANPRRRWRSTGASTPCPRRTCKRETLHSNTDLLSITPWTRRSAIGCPRRSDLTKKTTKRFSFSLQRKNQKHLKTYGWEKDK